MSDLMTVIGLQIIDRLEKSIVKIMGPYEHDSIPTWFDENGMGMEDHYKVRGVTITLNESENWAIVGIYPTRIVIQHRDYARSDENTPHESVTFLHDIRSPDFNVDRAVYYIYNILPNTSPVRSKCRMIY